MIFKVEEYEAEEEERPKLAKVVVSFIVIRRIALLVLLVESFLFFYLAHHSLAAALLLHLAVIVALMWSLKFFLSKFFDIRYLLLLILFCGSFWPRWGSDHFSLHLALYYLFASDAIPSASNVFYPKTELTASEFAYERIIYGLDDYHVDKVPIPFKDIMTFGTYQQKRIAIEKMLRYFRPEFTPALLIGLYDKSNAVRVQAATAISSIDNNYFDRYAKLSRLVKEHPRDMKLLKAYAEHCEEYADTEILDKDRIKKMRVSAIDAYINYLQHQEGDLLAQVSLGKLWMQNGDYAEAKQILEKAILQPNCPLKAWVFLMRSYYHLNDFDRLRNLPKTNMAH